MSVRDLPHLSPNIECGYTAPNGDQMRHVPNVGWVNDGPVPPFVRAKPRRMSLATLLFGIDWAEIAREFEAELAARVKEDGQGHG